MMKQSPTVLFFGNERLATGVTTTAPTLKALINAGYRVAAVILNQETAVSRKDRQPEIAALAASYGIPVIYPSKLAQEIEQLASFQAEVAVLAAYGKIVPESIIELFPAGIINIHPSLLPKHRGPTPIESVILNGEAETGVSIMKLVKAMDAGPVYAQRTIPVPAKVSKQALADQLLQIGSEMLVQHLPQILAGSLQPLPQDDANATYDSLIEKQSGSVDWSKPARQIEREIRAFQGWPKSRTMLGKHHVILLEADVVDTSGKPGQLVLDKNSLVVYCGEGALQIRRLQPENKKEMPVEAFLAGYTL